MDDLLKKGTVFVYSDQELDLRQRARWERDDPLDLVNGMPEDPGFYHWTVDQLAERRNVTKKVLFQELIGLEPGKRETMLLESFDAFQYLRDMYGIEWGRATRFPWANS